MRIAKEIKKRYGVVPRPVGVNQHPAVEDDWTVSLPQARETLHAVSEEIEYSVMHSAMSVLISNTCSVSLASLPAIARHYPDIMLL